MSADSSCPAAVRRGRPHLPVRHDRRRSGGRTETETITWHDPAGDTSTIAWGQPVVAGQTVVFAGTVTAGLYRGAITAKVTSGISYVGAVLPCLLGTPISQTTGLIDSLTITD